MVIVFKDRKDFTPDYSPIKMFRMGILGGSYFRPIYSQITGKKYTTDWREFNWDDIQPNKIRNPNYDPDLNYYKVKVGTSLEYWEDKGWIREQDPRGWIQWYLRYYEGRRSPDDERQIKRWIGVKQRFGKRKNKSNKIKQVLLEWGIAS